MQLQENPFLDKQNQYLNYYAEENVIEQFDGNTYDSNEDFQSQVYKTFIKEKSSILNYAYDLIIYAAKKQDFKIDELFEVEDQKKRALEMQSKILNEQDSFNIKNRITQLLMKYQEQNSILDPILQDFIQPTMKFIQKYTKKACQDGVYHAPQEISFIFEMIYNLCNVRGYKTVVKFFPHEAADMEPCVEYLHFQEHNCTEHWIPCILTLWLSLIVIVPFDISNIDSQKNKDKNYEILVKRIINIGRVHIQNAGKLRDYCAILLSKLLTRPDVIKQGETDQCLKEMAQDYLQSKEESGQMFKVSGILQTLVEVFKIGHRDDFLSRIQIVFESILKSEVKNKFMAKSTIIRKNRVKLAQRIGCIYLKPRITSWRYKRGSRTLNHLKQENDEQKMNDQNIEGEDEEMLNEDEVNFEQLEFIIQLLLDSLKDDDSVVRWTAAKGLGRITQRLTKDFADQIVEQLHDLFKETETESSWHGGCLALAELCRRGLLLPERLEMYVKVLDKALIYDINKGNHQSGSHVRDAACYVVWSFARAYSPDIMKLHVHTLSQKLIIESLFDREINCRRAASATFQECVGRQGNFPNGIEILTEADYFTLSNRTNAYLNVSCFVGQFQNYFESMVKHLAFVKLQHQEAQMRILSSQSLSVLCIFNPDLIVKEILTKLIEKCFSKVLHVRHGAILGVGEILIGMSGNSIINRNEVLEKVFKTLSQKEKKIIQDSENKEKFKQIYNEISKKNYMNEFLPDNCEIINNIRSIIEKFEKEKLYRGKGGEIMRAGVCNLIHSISIAKIKLEESCQKLFFQTLVENLKHPNQEIQDEASKALRTFCNSYFENNEAQNVADHHIIGDIQKMFDPSQNDPNISVTRGFNMAFGVLSKSILLALNPKIIEVLIVNSVPKNTESDDAETRKQSIKSLINIVKIIGIEKIEKNHRIQILEALYKGYDDYAVDKRGDVGSWVRQESMIQLGDYIHLIVVSEDLTLRQDIGADTQEFYERFISQNLQQLNEKIDRIREHAGRCLQKFFKYTEPHVNVNFSSKVELMGLFIADQSQFYEDDLKNQDDLQDLGIPYLPWRNAQFVFNSIKPFFDSEVYSASILKGLITSSGGLTESTLKASQNSLFEYLSDMTKFKKDANGQPSAENLSHQEVIEKKRKFINKMIRIFKENQKIDRVTVPLMKTIENLLTTDYLTEKELQVDIMEIHAVSVIECNKSKNIVKLLAAVGVFSGLMQSSDVELAKKSIKSLLFLLYHSFPKVRQMTAEKLYTGLLSMESYDHVMPDGEAAYEEFDSIISETDWNQDVKKLTNETKKKMYGFFGHDWNPAKKE